MTEIRKLAENLGLKFDNYDLLQQAVVHRSYINEHPNFKLGHNERLEYLGDAVLELVVTKYLFETYDNPEGDLTNWRSALVNSRMLAKAAKALEVEDYLLLSKGEQKDTGRAREYILGNTYEALVGAIYLDQGYESASEFIHSNLITELPHIIKEGLYEDPKSRLQEKVQSVSQITPDYKVLDESGPDHDRIFKVGVYFEDELVGTGTGRSKQEAQIAAAEVAWNNKSWVNAPKRN
ncbi:ribonuclease III [Patescibacteria group bacterium]